MFTRFDPARRGALGLAEFLALTLFLRRCVGFKPPIASLYEGMAQLCALMRSRVAEFLALTFFLRRCVGFITGLCMCRRAHCSCPGAPTAQPQTPAFAYCPRGSPADTFTAQRRRSTPLTASARAPSPSASTSSSSPPRTASDARAAAWYTASEAALHLRCTLHLGQRGAGWWTRPPLRTGATGRCTCPAAGPPVALLAPLPPLPLLATW